MYHSTYVIFVFLCLIYFTQIMSYTHVAANGITSFFFIVRNIPLYSITSSLSISLLIDIQLASVSCLCKQCRSKHQGACVLSDYGFLWTHDQEWDCQTSWWSQSQFLKISPYCSSQWLHRFTLPPTVQESSLFSTLFPAFIVCRFLMMAVLSSVR